MFPADRVAAVLRQHVKPYEQTVGRPKRGTGEGPRPGSITHLAMRSGVGERTIRGILNGHSANVRLQNLDALLCALDAIDLFHVPAELGGFADIYERPVTDATLEQERRREQRQRRWREAQQKKRGTLQPVEWENGWELEDAREQERFLRERRRAA